MRIQRNGANLTVLTPTGPEPTPFASEAEATARAAFANEAMTWIGTPFRDCADIKGPNGAVDCAMLLTRCAVDTGLLPPFDPRPYSPRRMLHSTDQHFLGWVQDKLGGTEVERPRIGDVVVWHFGRSFSHGAIHVGAGEVVHAWFPDRLVLLSRTDEPLLTSIPLSGSTMPRPVKFFDLWKSRR